MDPGILNSFVVDSQGTFVHYYLLYLMSPFLTDIQGGLHKVGCDI